MSLDVRRWLSRIRSKVVDAMVGWGVEKVLLPMIAGIVGPFFLSRLPIVGEYLTRPAPVWALLTIAVIVVVVATVAMRGRQPQSSPVPDRPRPPAKFLLGGLDWVLGPDFWGLYEYRSVHELSGQQVDSAVRAPFCTKCHEDATEAITKGNRCLNAICRQTFDMNPSGLVARARVTATTIDVREPFGNLKREVYTKAQAAAKRGELRRP